MLPFDYLQLMFWLNKVNKTNQSDRVGDTSSHLHTLTERFILGLSKQYLSIIKLNLCKSNPSTLRWSNASDTDFMFHFTGFRYSLLWNGIRVLPLLPELKSQKRLRWVKSRSESSRSGFIVSKRSNLDSMYRPRVVSSCNCRTMWQYANKPKIRNWRLM